MTMSYLAFATAVLFLIASPGPIISLIVSQSRLAIPKLIIVGTALAAQILLLISFTAILYAVNIDGRLLNVMQLVGGAYLLYLGWQAFLSAKEKQAMEQVNHQVGFWTALKLGLSNPKDILFLVAFLPSFIVVDTRYVTHAMSLMLIWLVIDCSVMVMYSLLAKKIFAWKTGELLLTYIPCVTISLFGCIAIAESLMGFIS